MTVILCLRFLPLGVVLFLLKRMLERDRIFDFERGLHQGPIAVILRTWCAMTGICFLSAVLFVAPYRLQTEGILFDGGTPLFLWNTFWNALDLKLVFVLSASVFPCWMRFVWLKRPLVTLRGTLLLSLAAIPATLLLPFAAMSLSILLAPYSSWMYAEGFFDLFTPSASFLDEYFSLFTALAHPSAHFLRRLFFDPSPLLCAYLFFKIFTYEKEGENVQ
jgi:hypothetical protein